MICFNSPFELTRVPAIRFGSGRLSELPELIAGFGRNALLVTGQRFFIEGGYWGQLTDALEPLSVRSHRVVVAQEPSPELVDEAVTEYRKAQIDIVVGIGGGSVLDAAKAIAGLLPCGNSVMDHLEGVGNGIPYRGPATPFIAVPTTAGTGSEATRNAVLSRQGPDGFKKSFRDEALVADIALVDPALLRDCPRDLMAAQGMDAFTQLLESYLSRAATPVTDALAWSGMEAFCGGFFRVVDADQRDGAALEKLAYSSLISGITLAHAGLGSVHGVAAPLGGHFPIPHGVACGTLLADAAEININLLRKQNPQGTALWKYARAGALLSGLETKDQDLLLQRLIDTLRGWVDSLEIPRLSKFGVTEGDIPMLVAGSAGGNMERNPANMSGRDIAALLRSRL